jgi:hypothetical protein
MKAHIVGLFTAAVLACASTARADVITITGGAWNEAANIDGGGMTLISDRFNLSGAWDCTGPWCGFSSAIWTPGATINLSNPTNGNGHGAAGTLDGVTYFATLPTGMLSFDDTEMTFTVAPFTVPAATPSSTRLTFDLPFAMTGVLTLKNSTGNIVFSNPIAGSGHLHLPLTSTVNGTYDLDRLGTSFVFEASASPAPEPATTVLLAFGLATVGAGKFRK